MDALIGWEWPGNVRELENFVERSVILTRGSMLMSPLSELAPAGMEGKIQDDSLDAAEREHILRALRESYGQITGPRGAAMRGIEADNAAIEAEADGNGFPVRSAWAVVHPHSVRQPCASSDGYC